MGLLAILLSVSLSFSFAQGEMKSYDEVNFDFINPTKTSIQKHVDYSITISKDGATLFESTKIIHASSGKVSIPFSLAKNENYDVTIKVHGILNKKIPVEGASFSISYPNELIQRQLTDKDTILVALAVNKNPSYENKAVPDWFKTQVSWWEDGLIDDTTFVIGLEYLIKEKIVNIPKLPYPSSLTEEKIPTWVKNNAVWWSGDLVSEEEFIKGIKFLVEKGIVRV